MSAESTTSSWRSRLGSWFAGIYAVLVVAVFALTAATTKADNVGLDWIPFVMLAMPWYRLNPYLLFPGFIANAIILYVVGALIEKLWRAVAKNGNA
jgi:hypothetical protein